MDVNNIKDALFEKINEYLNTDIAQDVIDLISTIYDSEPDFNVIDESLLAEIDDRIKQALVLHSICSNDDEVSFDSFSLSYNNSILSTEKFDSLVYTDKYISNNNNKPVFLIDNFNSINSFNKDTSLFFAKALLDNWDTIDYSTGINIFVPDCSNIMEEKLLPFLKLLILADGKYYHSRVESSNCFLDSRLKNQITCSIKDYRQYNEILNILSEYNNTKDVLQKYLLLYTVLENFMYRKPIAELVLTNTFTIRNFKELYKKVDNDELSVLKKLINKIYEEDIFPSINTKDHVKTEYDSFILANTTCEENFLKRLSFSTTNVQVDFARLVYILRNSIVHNKETEFHLTHFELNKISEGVVFFESYMLPILENIIYSILLKSNSFLDYNTPTISLYEVS